MMIFMDSTQLIYKLWSVQQLTLQKMLHTVGVNKTFRIAVILLTQYGANCSAFAFS